jgi:4-hydroxythreonine-4-phosphate dehydrogenase
MTDPLSIASPTATAPVIALTLGDPAGIGPELVAKLLAKRLSRGPDTAPANLVLVGDRWLWEEGQRVAGVNVPLQPVTSLAEVRTRPQPERPAWMPMDTCMSTAIQRGVAAAAGGQSVLDVLNHCMDAATAGHIDAITFAPLNKQAMKMGGLQHDDELHHFAHHLGVTSYFCEFNTLGSLWTSRISSHVPLRDVPLSINKQRIIDATTLIYRSLQANGVAAPRVAVAGLNPHNGDGGTCGREEIDIIAPAVAELQAQGMPVVGPFSPDTIFLKARHDDPGGGLDAIVTMYHDQGQIALKLLGFSQGVTVQGGLPIPITTPAHGTAYDIAGLGRANVDALSNALAIAVRMGQRHSYRHQDRLHGIYKAS